MGATIGTGTALVSGASALSNLFGGGGSSNASNVSIPTTYQYPNMSTAATGALSGNQNLTNYAGSVYPTYAYDVGTFYQANPYMSSEMSGVQNVANQAQGVGNNAINYGNSLYGAGSSLYGAANSLYGAGNSLLPYASSIMNTAFDPQQSLYNRTLQQTTDQTRAGLEARGLDTSTYGAGIEGDALRNFNIDWQNNQLNRQSTGASAASGLVGAAGTAFNNMGTAIGNAGTAFNTANQLGTSGLSTLTNAATLPYETYKGIGSDQLGALDKLIGAGTSANAVPEQQIQNYLSYLSGGTSASSVANQSAQVGLNKANLSNQQKTGWGNQLGSSLSSLFGGSGSGGGSSSNTFWPSSSFNNNSWGW